MQARQFLIKFYLFEALQKVNTLSKLAAVKINRTVYANHNFRLSKKLLQHLQF